MSRILLVDDDRAFRLSTAALLEDEGHDLTEAGDGGSAVEALQAASYDLMILDVRMPGIDGVDLVQVLRTRGEGVPILMISGFGTVETAVRALHSGADDFLTKPVEPGVLASRVGGLLTARPQSDGSSTAAGTILGRSEAIRQVVEDIERVAPADTTVLITGETGTGKELVARAVHAASGRAGAPFVAVNSAALSESLIESQLFGHVKGAFTGADRDHPGLFRAADGGTIFLDEVGDLSPSAQQRLLRVVQEGEVLPVGAVEAGRVDVRVLAATHRDLEASTREGTFREDLFYRLNVFRIHLPPLRERTQDVPLLIEHFLSGVASATGPRVSPLALRRLVAFDWPGNIRQLFSALESALIRAGRDAIQVQHLPPEVREAGETSERYGGPADVGDEKNAIEDALRRTGGKKADAARILGMGRTTLWRKMREHGLE